MKKLNKINMLQPFRDKLKNQFFKYGMRQGKRKNRFFKNGIEQKDTLWYSL